MNQKDDKDPNKDTEEEFKKLLDELKTESNKQNAVAHAFLLHKNFAVHLLMALIINFLITIVLIGLSSAIHYPLIKFDVLGLIVALLLFTLLENFVKILVFRYLYKVVVYSMGILSFAITMIIFYLVNLIVVDGFDFTNFLHLLIFSLFFTVLRFILSVYIRRWIYQKDIPFIGGKS